MLREDFLNVFQINLSVELKVIIHLIVLHCFCQYQYWKVHHLPAIFTLFFFFCWKSISYFSWLIPFSILIFFFLKANVIDSALGLESRVCNILICTFRCDFHGSSWYESFANLPPVLLTLPVPCPVFLNVQHYFWYHCSPDGSTWALDTCSLPLILLLSFTSLLSPFSFAGVISMCITRPSSCCQKFLYLLFRKAPRTGYHNWPTYIT